MRKDARHVRQNQLSTRPAEARLVPGWLQERNERPIRQSQVSTQSAEARLANTYPRGRGGAQERTGRPRRPQLGEEQREASWPGPEPSPQDQARLQAAMKRHRETHSLQDALQSMQGLHMIMQEFDGKGVIPNRNAMQIYLQHCCAKSASHEVEAFCLESADLALIMMERHNCRFDVATVIQIVLQLSLRAEMARAAEFVHSLVQKALVHLHVEESSFIKRHIIFALAERMESVHESLSQEATFAERGLWIDWEKSTSQEFHLYNTACHTYKPTVGYGFKRKGLVSLLSIDPDQPSPQYWNYSRQRDGAIVEVTKANDDEPLVVRLRTQVAVPFGADLRYRLDHMDTAEVQTKRMMECMKILGKDPQCSRLLPDPQLCQMLLLPPEEPYNIKIRLRPNIARLATLESELDLWSEGVEPFRIQSIGQGALLDWNLANPSRPVSVGDRVLEINRVRSRTEMVDEILTAQGLSYELHITLAKKVRMHERNVPANALMPRSQEVDSTFAKEEHRMRDILNASQVEAVRQACTQRLCLIQGPPGTGKTTTAIELLDFLLTHDLVPTPILVSGHTNAAVDNILAGLAGRGKRVVRIGEGDKVREECRPYLLGEERSTEPHLAEVVFATCIGSGGGVFQREGLKIHTVLIDECSQAPETACLVPICWAVQHLILIGDQCQLQPMVKSDLARSQDFGVSLFNRFCRQGVPLAMLDTQYRMHPAIADFPSGAFYNGLLRSGVHPADRLPTRYWEWPSRASPVCFVDAQNGWDSSWEGGHEVTNAEEVRLVLLTLKKLLRDPDLSVTADDGTYPVGIITPYAAQKELIKSELEKAGIVDLNGKQLVETNSVDGFQGREKDIIIFSAVRSNDTGTVGFLHDWRRINVMLTRARRGLIIIGNRKTLETDYFWKSWLKWASVHGCVQGERAGGTWKPLCLVDDEWVMKARDSASKSVSAVCVAAPEPACQGCLADCTSSGGDRWQEPIKPCVQSRTQSAAAAPPLADSWEDLTDVESEDGGDSSALDTGSWADFSAAESLATEPLAEVVPIPCEACLQPTHESVAESSALAPLQESTAAQQCQSSVTSWVLPESSLLSRHADEPLEAAAVAGSSQGPFQEQPARTFSRLRSEAGQQRQRDRQRLRREERRRQPRH